MGWLPVFYTPLGICACGVDGVSLFAFRIRSQWRYTCNEIVFFDFLGNSCAKCKFKFDTRWRGVLHETTERRKQSPSATARYVVQSASSSFNRYARSVDRVLLFTHEEVSVRGKVFIVWVRCTKFALGEVKCACNEMVFFEFSDNSCTKCKFKFKFDTYRREHAQWRSVLHETAERRKQWPAATARYVVRCASTSFSRDARSVDGVLRFAREEASVQKEVFAEWARCTEGVLHGNKEEWTIFYRKIIQSSYMSGITLDRSV